jgi:hypothetical protein
MKRLTVFAALLLLFAVSTSYGQFTDLNTDLVRYYQFDGNAKDSSISGADGTGDGTYQYVDGKFGQALYLNQDAGLGEVTAVPLNTTGSLTVSAWVKPDNLTWGTVVMERNYAGSDYCGPSSAGNYYLQSHFGKWAFATATVEPQDGTQCTYTIIESSNVIVPGRYYHVVGVFDAQARMNYLYVDGRLEATGAGSGSLRTEPNAILRIGQNAPPHAPQQFNGLIDDLRIYNRALSLAEITDLFKVGENKAPLANAGSNQSIRTIGPRYH